MENKKCKKCNVIKASDEFYYQRAVCKKCLSDNADREKKLKYNKVYYSKNREKQLEQKRSERLSNPDFVKERDRKRYQKDKEKIKKRRGDYYKKNKDVILEKNKEYLKNHREEKNEYFRNRLKKEPLFRLIKNLRSSFNQYMKVSGYRKKYKTEEMLGCSFLDFKLHLESKFESWMTWENRGMYNGEFNFGWDIDHIIPLSSANSEEELIKLNHYTNLQPLCSKMNRDIKKNKINFSLISV